VIVTKLKPKTRRQLRLALGHAAAFLAIWLLWASPVVYPLKIFVVLLHEISHGLAAVATGGTIDRILLSPDEGGVTYARGGNAFLILSAGYLGSLAWGLLLLVAAGARAARVRVIVASLGFFVLGIAIFFVRGWFGWLFALTASALLLVSARQLGPAPLRALLTVVALTSSLYALLDIRSDILARPDARSDAFMLYELTGIHTLVWGFLWTGIALMATFLVFRRVFRAA
jgi:hypothetical protein